jgi:tetratricopeptide (TPR) repeat protein
VARRRRRGVSLLLRVVLVGLPLTARTAEPCRTPDGSPAPAVAQLVSMVGDVRINDRTPGGGLPFVAICAGDIVRVGAASRAAVYLIDADTPLRLDENTVSRFEPPPESGSGTVALLRGALYFLSEVRRTLTVRTPYVNAGVEGTEVYLRVADAGTPAAGTELIVLEGKVALTPGDRRVAPLPREAATTGERIGVDAAGPLQRAQLEAPGGPFAALRQVAVGQLSWTLFYPDVLVAGEAEDFPAIVEAARLLAAGQANQAQAILDGLGGEGAEAGLRDALRATIAVGRKDTARAQQLAERAVAAAPDLAAPRLALSYARQLAIDLNGAFAATDAAVARAPASPLPRARLAELHLMRGETRWARRAARKAMDLGDGPLAHIMLGFTELAALRGPRAEAAFRRALSLESWNPLALLGLGLARIKQGDLAAGAVQIENAVAHDPSSSLLRSYLGRTFFEQRNDRSAGKQYAIAKELDPEDPTPWFYDAIRLQLDNRPVEALREAQRSIELNDNRAPFRSRTLLNEDLATRGASLGRIYDDLGFQELGIDEAARSLSLDPSSAAAHRFLSDLYLGEPRLESARVSELLQSQLLQQVGLNPIQPSLAFTDLDTVSRAGPLTSGFNEFSPVFVQDGIRIDATGVLGTEGVRGDEAAVTGLVGRTSFSAGQYHYETNGFRDNNQLENDILTVFAQTDPTEELSLQAEYRRRDSNFGDRRMFFDLDEFNETRHEAVNESIYRLGARLSPWPGSDLLVSGIYADREDRFDFEPFEDATIEEKTSTNIGQVEAQYLASAGPFRFTLGAGRVVTDGDKIQSLPFQEPFSSDAEITATDAYLLTSVAIGHSVDLSLRLGYDDVDLDDKSNASDTSMAAFTPGIGVIWRPDRATQVRAALGRTVSRPFVAEQTLHPTQLAGFNQQYDDLDGTRAEQLNLSLMREITGDITVGSRAMWRRFSRELVADTGETNNLNDQRQDRLGAFLYWTPTDRLAVSLEATRDTYRRKDRDTAEGDPLRVDTVAVPLGVTWFHPFGWFVGGTATWLHQDVEYIDFEDNQIRQDDSGTLVDVFAGLRLPKRRGVLAFEIANVLDQRLSYQDESLWTSSQVNPRFIPSRTFLVSLTLNF